MRVKPTARAGNKAPRKDSTESKTILSQQVDDVWYCEECERELASDEECYCQSVWTCDECGRELKEDEDCYCLSVWECDECGRELKEEEECYCQATTSDEKETAKQDEKGETEDDKEETEDEKKETKDEKEGDKEEKTETENEFYMPQGFYMITSPEYVLTDTDYETLLDKINQDGDDEKTPFYKIEKCIVNGKGIGIAHTLSGCCRFTNTHSSFLKKLSTDSLMFAIVPFELIDAKTAKTLLKQYKKGKTPDDGVIVRLEKETKVYLDYEGYVRFGKCVLRD